AAIQAAVLDIKLKHLDSWHEGRRRNAAIYNERLAGTRAKMPRILDGNWSIYNQYVIRVPDRDGVKAKLAEAGIGSAVYYPLPLHLQPCFAYLGHKRGEFPVSEAASGEVLALPIYPELEAAEVEYVAETVAGIVGSRQ
ncbi:MAG TPA: DegT/DnrJ/EryC1/StrS family aminotransferase, partial [Tepidisphaeraceae bacterium]|nr:DegT/DnrJ/EryC1/StrS family aminotransferase [Tepidisphaeraceae bacterium]